MNFLESQIVKLQKKLETTHKETDEVNRSRLNTLSQEYEMFRMLLEERILEMQKRFTHTTNIPVALRKALTKNELNLKILISNMSLAALFGKLQEHELELARLEQHE